MAAEVAVGGAGGAGGGALRVRAAPAETARGGVHRAVVTAQRNARRGTAATKTRSDVRGGGKKPYAQKGTGNARRGSSRSPLVVGGGVVFGPQPRDWSIKMNQKVRPRPGPRLHAPPAPAPAPARAGRRPVPTRPPVPILPPPRPGAQGGPRHAGPVRALSRLTPPPHPPIRPQERRLAMGTALQSAAEGGAVSVVPDMEGAFASRKTRDCVEKLGSMGVGTAGGKLSEKCLVVTKDDANVDLYLAGRNLPGLEFNTADRLNLVEVLRADRILVEESALTAINERYG